jgi:hypothetical protein
VWRIGAAVAAHAAAARYDYLLVEYARTKAQLERVVDKRNSRDPTGSADEADDAFVAECEHAISAQNESWMSKLSRDS